MQTLPNIETHHHHIVQASHHTSHGREAQKLHQKRKMKSGDRNPNLISINIKMKSIKCIERQS